MKHFTRTMTAAAAAALMTTASVAAASTADTERVAGPDRYATSAAASRYVSSHSSPDISFVVVATAWNFADGLSAGAAAGAMRGHMLLVPPSGTLPASVATELRRLGQPTVIVAGGKGAVSDSMMSQIKAITPHVTRFDGVDRYETAAIFGQGIAGNTMFIASGLNFPDALTGGAAAGAVQGGMLLSTPTVLPTSSVLALKSQQPARVVVLGGAGVLADPILAQAKKAVPNASVFRVSGGDRYATAAAISRYLYPGTKDTVYLASGAAYPDALSASAVAGGQRGPLLLTNTSCVPQATLTEIDRLHATKFVAVGGPSALTQAVIDRVPC